MPDATGKSPLSEGMRALDRETPASLPGDSYARLLTRLENRRSSVLGRVGIAAASVLLVVAALAVWHPWRSREVAGFEIAAQSPDARWLVDEDGAIAVTHGETALRVSELGARAALTAGARLRREGTGVRVVAGRAHFSVLARGAAGGPFVVLVSHGRIEVLGTEFGVEQGPQGGALHLESGRLRFVTASHDPVMVSPGESLAWPLPANPAAPAPLGVPATLPSPAPHQASTSAVAAPIAPPQRGLTRRRLPAPAEVHGPPQPDVTGAEGTAVDSPPQPRALRDYVAEIDGLRIRRDYDLLATRLTEILAMEVGEPMRESLSYELCDVLTRHGRDQARTCAQLLDHLGRYPRGRYAAALEREARSRGCLR